MKKILFILSFIILVSFASVNAVSIHYTSSQNKFTFEPNLEKTFKYTVINNLDQTVNLRPYATGDLAKYVVFSSDFIENVGAKEGISLSATFKFPESIDVPGDHTVRIGVVEERPGQEGMGARGGIEIKYSIRVRYPGKYIETALSAGDVQVGKIEQLKVIINNFGSENINEAYATINLFDGAGNNIGTVFTDRKANLLRDESYTLYGSFDTTGLSPGEYSAVAEVTYDGNKKETNKAVFRIGEINLKTIGTSQSGYAWLPNQFDVAVSSEWNNPIEVYANIDMLNGTTVVQSFKTTTERVNAWKTRNISGYFNAEGFSAGNYSANVTIFYAGKTGEFFGPYELVKKPVIETPFFADKTNLILVVIITLSVLMNIFWFIMSRGKKNKKNKKKHG